jgi:hypothetical protein
MLLLSFIYLSGESLINIYIWIDVLSCFREYHEESNTNKPVVRLGDARENVSSLKNKLSAFEAFKTGMSLDNFTTAIWIL